MTAMKETKNPVTENGKVIKERDITVGTTEIMKEGTATDVKIRGTIVGRMKKILRSIEKIGLGRITEARREEAKRQREGAKG